MRLLRHAVRAAKESPEAAWLVIRVEATLDSEIQRDADRLLALPWELLRIDGDFPVEKGELDVSREAVQAELEGLPKPDRPLSVVAAVAATTHPGHAQIEVSGDIDLETRGFLQAPLLDGQRRHAASVSARPELYWAWGRGDQSLTVEPFLRWDAEKESQIRASDAATIRTLVDGGYDPKTVVAAVKSGDWSKLVHTGKLSVQLQEPGTTAGQQDQPEHAGTKRHPRRSRTESTRASTPSLSSPRWPASAAAVDCSPWASQSPR